jgi:RNA polymerase primary sigma factor
MKHVVSNSSHTLYGGFVNRYTSFGRTISYRSFALNKIGSINKINKMYALLEQSNERPPSAEEIAELDMTVNDVKESMKKLVVTCQWMHLLLKEKILTFTMYCVLVNLKPRELIHESLRTEIERSLETLTPREADVVRLYFGW